MSGTPVRRIKVRAAVLNRMIWGAAQRGGEALVAESVTVRAALAFEIGPDAELLAVEDVGRGEAAFWLVYAHPSFLAADQSVQETDA